MKLITRDTDYAIRAISCIAGAGRQELSVRDLTVQLGIPRPFLRKILQVLNKEGILHSQKGKGGGFSLAVRPEKITVHDLIVIFQGEFEISEHVVTGNICPFIRSCYLKKKLDNAQDYLARAMKSITVASLLRNSVGTWPEIK
ncbi:MAG: Rrf2 family transcriptional regulator [Candidatus Omnitrophota bacterium]